MEVNGTGLSSLIVTVIGYVPSCSVAGGDIVNYKLENFTKLETLPTFTETVYPSYSKSVTAPNEYL